MQKNIYKSFKIKRDDKRKIIESQSSEITNTQGYRVVPPFSKEELFEQGVYAATRIAISTVITAADELGWEKYCNLLFEKQTPGMRKDIENLIKKYNMTSRTALDVNNLGYAHAFGCGFSRHKEIELKSDYTEEAADWCPMIHEMQNMGYGHRLENLHEWCNVYDDLYMNTMNPNVFLVHTYCIGKGDRYCRVCSCYADAVKPGESFYQKIKDLCDEEYERMMEISPDPEPVNNMWVPQMLEDLTELDIWQDGVKTKFDIAIDNILIASQEMGWEKFINLVGEEQSWGYKKAAQEMKKDLDINGNSLKDVAACAMLGYQMLGFKNHQIIQLTNDRVEGISDWCPIMAQAEKAELADNMEDLSLWCDFYHNHQVKAVNPECGLCHTHCIGKGDKYCRFVIEKIFTM